MHSFERAVVVAAPDFSPMRGQPHIIVQFLRQETKGKATCGRLTKFTWLPLEAKLLLALVSLGTFWATGTPICDGEQELDIRVLGLTF